jgi:hypothetical protein
MATNPGSGHECKEIVGLDNIALTFDGGKTLVRSRTPVKVGPRLHDLVSLGSPYALAALVEDINGRNTQLFLSTDGGCSWTSRGEVPVEQIVEGHDGTAYGWGDKVIFAVSVGGIRRFDTPYFLFYLHADPARPGYLRVFDDQAIHEVQLPPESGEAPTWTRVGPPKEIFLHEGHLATDPHDWNHLLLSVGLERDVELTRDGGRTWRRATYPMTKTLFTAGLTFEGDGATAWWFTEPFAKSVDGGESFTPVPSPTGFGYNLMLEAPPDEARPVFWWADGRSRGLLTFDTRSLLATMQPLPLEPQIDRPGYRPEFTQVRAGTFVPGEGTAICLGLQREGGIPHGDIW